jgi:CRP-like cAMP-binding protein
MKRTVTGMKPFEAGRGRACSEFGRNMTRATHQTAQSKHSLADVDLFRTVDDSERREVERHCRWRWWKPGTIIVDQNTASEWVYFVVAGNCRVQNILGQKRGIVLDEIGPGGYFGEIGAIDGGPRSATVIAAERTLTAELERQIFLTFVMAHPRTSLLLMQRLTEVIRQADSQIMELCGLSAHSRICSELLRQAKTGGGLPVNVARIIPIPLHKHIAARANTTRETVARSLADLARRQLVQRERNTLIVTDVAALFQMITV